MRERVGNAMEGGRELDGCRWRGEWGVLVEGDWCSGDELIEFELLM